MEDVVETTQERIIFIVLCAVIIICVAGLAWFTQRLIRIAEKRLVTVVGFRWDYTLAVVYFAVAARYAAALTSPDGKHVGFRFVLWMLGIGFMGVGLNMARRRWLEVAKELPNVMAEKRKRNTFDWNRDVRSYEYALVLFSIGLALLQMS